MKWELEKMRKLEAEIAQIQLEIQPMLVVLKHLRQQRQLLIQRCSSRVTRDRQQKRKRA